jgi:hypothetical protein
MKTNMLLIIVFGLFAQLALVWGDCENTTITDFDWLKVGIIVLIIILKQTAAKTTELVKI